MPKNVIINIVNLTSLLNHIIYQLRPENFKADEFNIVFPYLFVQGESIDLSKLGKVHFFGLGTDNDCFYDFLIDKIPSDKKGIFVKLTGPKDDEGELPGEQKSELFEELEIYLEQPQKNDLVLIHFAQLSSTQLHLFADEMTNGDYQQVQQQLRANHPDEMEILLQGISQTRNGGFLSLLRSKNIVVIYGNGHELSSKACDFFQFKRSNLPMLQQIISHSPLEDHLKQKLGHWFNSLTFENLQLQKRIDLAQKDVYFHSGEGPNSLHTMVAKLLAQFYPGENKLNKHFPIYSSNIDLIIMDEIQRIKDDSTCELFLSGGHSPNEKISSNKKYGQNIYFTAVMSNLIFKDNIFNLSDEQMKKCCVFALSTTGSDDNSPCAGAYMDWAHYDFKKNFKEAISQGKIWELFQKTETLININPTNVNLMDLRFIYIPR